MAAILDRLHASLAGMVYDQEELRRFYSVDSSLYTVLPEIVVVPANKADIAATVKLARQFGTSVTVRGAGTGLVGSALNDGIILDTTQMTSFEMCLAGNQAGAMVGPGISKGRLDVLLAEHAKMFAPNPSIGPFCSVGGMLGCNASGSRSIKYGSVIDNVAEVTFIDGNANVVTLPGNTEMAHKIYEIASSGIDESKFPKVTKNSCGYRIDCIKSPQDAHKIIMGSEGTLGIITSAILRIVDTPKRRILFVVEYDSVYDAAGDCSGIVATGPSAVEFVDGSTCGRINHTFAPNTKCLLFVEYDEHTSASRQILCEAVEVGRISIALDDEEDISRWWRYRESALSYSLASAAKHEVLAPHVIEDAAVSLERLGDLFSIQDELNREYGTRCISYGHAGNGNIHIRLLSSPSSPAGTEIKNIASQYFEQVTRLGGTITAEHGDGLARSEFVRLQYGDQNCNTFAKIKRLLDPDNVLNPGKIVL